MTSSGGHGGGAQGGPLLRARTEVILEFLEVAVHSILYNRGLYPKEIFEQQRLYDSQVWKSRHPDLNEYVFSHVESLKAWVEQGEVEKVAVAVFDKGHELVERYVFRFQVASGAGDPPDGLSATLRSFLARMNWADAQMAEAPPGATWEIIAYHLHGETGPDWVVEDNKVGRVEMPERGFEVVPIKSWVQGPIKLNSWAEKRFEPGGHGEGGLW